MPSRPPRSRCTLRDTRPYRGLEPGAPREASGNPLQPHSCRSLPTPRRLRFVGEKTARPMAEALGSVTPDARRYTGWVRISRSQVSQNSGTALLNAVSLGVYQIMTGSDLGENPPRRTPCQHPRTRQTTRVESHPEGNCGLEDLLTHGQARACSAARRDTYARLEAIDPPLARIIDPHGSGQNNHLLNWYIDCSLQLPDGGHGTQRCSCTHRAPVRRRSKGRRAGHQRPRRHRGGRTRAR
jgi:hypothetical protein